MLQLGVPQTSLLGKYQNIYIPTPPALSECGHVVPRGSHMAEGRWMMMMTVLNAHVLNAIEVNT